MAQAWRALPFAWQPSETVLAETLGGGQAFRWNRLARGHWHGIWTRHSVELRQQSNGQIEWRGIHTSEDDLKHYFAASLDFASLADSLPWRSDPRIFRAISQWSGLRILRQPFAETLLAFLCSPTKRIPQISAILEELARRFGPALAHGHHALPSWEILHQAGENGLRTTGMGYRAKGIAGTAAFLASSPGWLEETETLPYPEAKIRLMSLPGVGEKIADCVLLFGAGRLEAFPVDTWVIKAMARLYDLDGWSPAQIAHFGRTHFGPYAGYAQQLLFSEERRQGSAKSEATHPGLLQNEHA